jgi:hypothetical protein
MEQAAHWAALTPYGNLVVVVLVIAGGLIWAHFTKRDLELSFKTFFVEVRVKTVGKVGRGGKKKNIAAKGGKASKQSSLPGSKGKKKLGSSSKANK